MQALQRQLFLALFLILVPALSARTWTDVGGRKMEAELLRHDPLKAVFLLSSGRTVTVPLNRLSDADREFIESGVEPEPEPEAETETEAETAAKAKAKAKAKAGDAEVPKPSGGGTSPAEEQLNWDQSWPEYVDYKDDLQIDIVEEDAEAKRWVYESSHYRFICDVRLSKSVVGNLAEMFESSLQYTRALPLAVTGGRTNDGKYDILLFEEFDSYVDAGGPPSSAGVFMGGKNVVMVPLQSLGVRKVGSGYMRDRDKSNRTLVHEIVHQLTPGSYFSAGARGWFTEGLAEYCAWTPYRNGRFKARNALESVEEAMTGYDKKWNRGRNIGSEFTAPDLKEFMRMSYGEFTGPNANFNYAFSGLLAAYFFHLDGEGDGARMKSFLQALRAQGRGGGGDSDAVLEKLLDGRSWDELEEQVASKWRRKGVKIAFS